MLKSFLSRLGVAVLTSRRGATAIEYGLLAALVAVAIVSAATLVGTNLTGTFNNVAGELTS
jgi:pilus assembly protein Flp/PilA